VPARLKKKRIHVTPRKGFSTHRFQRRFPVDCQKLTGSVYWGSVASEADVAEHESAFADIVERTRMFLRSGQPIFLTDIRRLPRKMIPLVAEAAAKGRALACANGWIAIGTIDAPAPAPERPMIDVTPARLTLSEMVEDCISERGWPDDRANHVRGIFGRLEEMLGHNDGTLVTTADIGRFKKLLLATPNKRNGAAISRNTVKQSLSPVKVVFQHAINNGLGDGAVTDNPARSVTVEGVVVGTRDDFTKEEERTILTAARDQRNEIRWFTWLMAMSGCSNKEAVNASRDDFRREGDLLTWDIKGTKTDYRARVIPLRAALVAEGFEDWLNTLQSTQALFSELRIGAKTNDWIKSLGISKTVYSFRHGMKTKLRSAMMPSDERNYYQGHAAADVAATYGTNLATTLAVYIERLPAPLSAPSGR